MLELERDKYTDDGEPPVAWERYLRIAPSLSGLDAEAREAVLAPNELDGVTWARAESYWTLTLALELTRGRSDRADAYGLACAKALEARHEGAAPEEDTLPEAGADAVAITSPIAPPALAGPPAPAVVMAPEVTVPTFLRTPPTAPMGLGPRTHVRVVPPPSPRTPVDPGPPGYVRAAPLAPSAPRSPLCPVDPPGPSRHATVEISAFALAAGRVALPFAPAPPGAAVSASPRRPSAVVQSGATLDLSELCFDPRGNVPPPAGAEAEGRDRRTERGTVEIDPAALASLFARKPAP